MTWTYQTKKQWALFGLFMVLYVGANAQDAISPNKMKELNQDLAVMKELMGDTLVKAEGNAMSLIYFWVSQQEKRMDSLRTETQALNTEIEALSQRPPKDTSAISRIYQMLDSMRIIEESFASPAN